MHVSVGTAAETSMCSSWNPCVLTLIWESPAGQRGLCHFFLNKNNRKKFSDLTRGNTEIFPSTSWPQSWLPPMASSNDPKASYRTRPWGKAGPSCGPESIGDPLLGTRGRGVRTGSGTSVCPRVLLTGGHQLSVGDALTECVQAECPWQVARPL